MENHKVATVKLLPVTAFIMNMLSTMRFSSGTLAGDFWGGLAAMLVALPSAIAFGVTIYAAVGPTYVGLGALAGILGTTALGLIASTFGGTNRLITAPCAPAAAILSAFAIHQVQQGTSSTSIILMLTMLGLLAGIIQLLFGNARIGTFIKFIPYPVVSGYLSGVGLIIIGSQIPKLLGVPSGGNWWQAIFAPELWNWHGLVIGIATAVVMLVAPKFTRVVPAAILGLMAGVLAYFGLALTNTSLLVVDGNPLVIGPMGGDAGGLVQAVVGRWQDIGELKLGEIGRLFGTALTLAVLLSIDTLKTCVVLDALTRSRHDSNRELTAQGLGNILSACVGGMPGAGQMGATLVNFSSGGQSKISGVIEGMLALIAFILLGTLIAWIPVASLAGILIIVGIRMIDLHSFRLLTSRWTVFDFVVVATVVATALTISLIAASGIGIVLAMLLFIREQLSSTVIRHKGYGHDTFSKKRRPQAEMKTIEKSGDSVVIVQLQGSLFFGTKDQLYTALEPELSRRAYVILDFRWVQAVDISAVHVLTQIRDTLMERDAYLIFSNLPQSLPNGCNVVEYFDQMELTTFTPYVKVFPQIDDALEWVEDRTLGKTTPEPVDETPLELMEMEIFKERKDETLSALEAILEKRSYKASEKVYALGDSGGELFLIRRGLVRILVPAGDNGSEYHLMTCGRGDFFGALSYLDQQERGNEAIAVMDTDVFVLRRDQLEHLIEDHKRLVINLLEAISLILANRLRYAETELAALQS